MRGRIRMLGVLAAAALLSGCTHAPAAKPLPHPSAAVIASTTGVVRPAWTTKVDLVGRPIVRNGIIASYVRAGRDLLQVRAWQLADGVELWRRDAVLGGAPRGMEVDLEAVRYRGGDYVTFPAVPSDGSPSELVVAALATGSPRHVKDPIVATTRRPEQCGDDVCFTGWSLDTQHLKEPARALRVNLHTGRIGVDRVTPLPKGAASLGDGVFVTGTGATERLGYTQHGTVLWTRPYASVFGAGATADGGWDWHRQGSLLLGWGGRPTVLKNHRYVWDASGGATVALDAKTGTLRWRIRHAGACLSEDLSAWSADDRIDLCTMTGLVTTPVTSNVDPSALDYSGLRIARIGVKVRSGSVLWTRAEPTRARLDSDPVPVSDGRWLPVTEAGRTRLLDRVSGSITPLPRTAAVACTLARPWAATREDGGDEGSADAGSAVTVSGDGPMSRFALTTGGVSGGYGWWIVPGVHTLAAYHLTD